MYFPRFGASGVDWPAEFPGKIRTRVVDLVTGEDIVAPAQDEEFVISHSDNVQATGFVEHLKLPHYVDFQAELGLVRRMRAEFEAARSASEPSEKKEAAE